MKAMIKAKLKTRTEEVEQNSHLVQPLKQTVTAATKELNTVERLIEEISNFRADHKKFEELALQEKIITDRYDKLRELTKQIFEVTVDGKKKQLIAVLGVRDKTKEPLSAISTALNSIREFAFTLLGKINTVLADVNLEHINAIAHIEEVIHGQVQRGIPRHQLITAGDRKVLKELIRSQSKQLLSTKNGLLELTKLQADAQKQINSVLLTHGQLDFEQEIATYYECMGSIANKYSKIIISVARDSKQATASMYATIPWYNPTPQARAVKIAAINRTYEATTHEGLTTHSPQEVAIAVNKNFKEIANSSDFNLFQTYRAFQKSHEKKEYRLYKDDLGHEIFKDNKEIYDKMYKPIIENLGSLIQTFSLASKEENECKKWVAKETIFLLLKCPEKLRLNIFKLVDPKIGPTQSIRELILYNPDVQSAHIYGEVKCADTHYQAIQHCLKILLTSSITTSSTQAFADTLWEAYLEKDLTVSRQLIVAGFDQFLANIPVDVDQNINDVVREITLLIRKMDLSRLHYFSQRNT